MITVTYLYTCDVPNCGVAAQIANAAAPGQVMPNATPPAGWRAQWNFIACPKHSITMGIDGRVVVVSPG